MPVDADKIAAAVRDLLAALGENPDNPRLQHTPDNVAAAFAEWCSGKGQDAQALLKAGALPAAAPGQLVAVRDIEFVSFCEHHLLPFIGTAQVVYQTGTQIAGFGTIARLVQALAGKLQLQERLTEEIAATLASGLNTQGVLVQLTTKQGCLSLRGAKQKNASTVTVTTLGALQTETGRLAALELLKAGADA